MEVTAAKTRNNCGSMMAGGGGVGGGGGVHQKVFVCFSSNRSSLVVKLSESSLAAGADSQSGSPNRAAAWQLPRQSLVVVVRIKPQRDGLDKAVKVVWMEILPDCGPPMANTWWSK